MQEFCLQECKNFLQPVHFFCKNAGQFLYIIFGNNTGLYLIIQPDIENNFRYPAKKSSLIEAVISSKDSR